MWPLTCILYDVYASTKWHILEPFNTGHSSPGQCDLRYHLILWSWFCRAVVVECSDVRSGGWKEVASERATRQQSLSEVARSETGFDWWSLGNLLLLFYMVGSLSHYPPIFWGRFFGNGLSKNHPWSLLRGIFRSIPGTWMSSRFEASRCFKNSWRSFRRNSRAFPGRWVFPVNSC